MDDGERTQNNAHYMDELLASLCTLRCDVRIHCGFSYHKHMLPVGCFRCALQSRTGDLLRIDLLEMALFSGDTVAIAAVRPAAIRARQAHLCAHLSLIHI